MFSLLLQLSSELQLRAARCPGFLHTAVLSYMQLLQVYLDGLELELKAASQLSNNQVTQISGSLYTVNFFFWHNMWNAWPGGVFSDPGPGQAVSSACDFTDTYNVSVLPPTHTGNLETGCVNICSSAETCQLHLGPFSLSCSLVQLKSQCEDVDPDVAAALSVHLSPDSLSPEMDFLWATLVIILL